MSLKQMLTDKAEATWQFKENTQEKAFMDPMMVLQVNKQFGEITWRRMMDAYVSDMDLEFVKTTQEIQSQGKNLLKYNR